MPTTQVDGSQVNTGILKGQVTLTDAHVKALFATPTVPVDIVPACDPDKRYVIITALVQGRFSAGAYTNLDTSDGAFWLGVSTGDALTDSFPAADFTYFFADVNRDRVLHADYSTQDASLYAGQPIQIRAYSGLGALTGGNAANQLIVTVRYTIEDV